MGEYSIQPNYTLHASRDGGTGEWNYWSNNYSDEGGLFNRIESLIEQEGIFFPYEVEVTESLDFAKEWPFTVTEQTMTDGWTWYRVEGIRDMTLAQIEDVYHGPRGGFELVTVDEGEEADSIPESFVNMLEEVFENGRVVGLFPEPKTQHIFAASEDVKKLLEYARFLKPCTKGENPEYVRGMAELIMLVTGENSDNLDNIVNLIEN